MVLWLFVNVLIDSEILNKKPAKLIKDDLLNKLSYRYKPAQQYSFRTIFVFLRLAFKNCWYPTIIKEEPGAQPADPSMLVFDSRYEYLNRKRYLTYLKLPAYLYLARNFSHFPPSFFQKFSITLQVAALFPFIFLAALFNKNRGNLGLLACELVEINLLLLHLKKIPGIKQVLLFSAYEKDCNFISFLLMNKFDITVQVVPSSTPIKNFYKKGICSIFTMTSPFHLFEFEQFKANWNFIDTVSWPPFGYEEVLPRISTYKKAPANTIGFYSSGSWLREKLGYPTVGINEREAEKLLIGCLVRYFQANPDKKLIIFLHPLEKKSTDHLEQSIQFYSKVFGKEIEFGPFQSNSVTSFDLVDLGIAGYSSTVFQRLFAGQKTALAPFTMPGDYFSDPNLESICIRSEKQLNDLITTLLNLPTECFIEQYNLQAYTFNAYSSVIDNRFFEHEQH